MESQCSIIKTFWKENDIDEFDQYSKEYFIINGKVESTYRCYYISGNIWQEIEFVNGNCHGKAILYYNRHGIYSIQYYKDNKIDG
jgi:antitoxin component YwqK of YwqJK toxin-antitoxin module